MREDLAEIPFSHHPQPKIICCSCEERDGIHRAFGENVFEEEM